MVHSTELLTLLIKVDIFCFNLLIIVGAGATMSMPSTKPFLWEMLAWQCPLDCGRTAFIPETGVLVSAFKAMKENGKDSHVIKTIMSGAQIGPFDEEEETVTAVTARRHDDDGTVLYKTIFASGVSEWLSASSFINADGTVTDAWLAFVSESELRSAFTPFTKSQLKVRSLFEKERL